MFSWSKEHKQLKIHLPRIKKKNINNCWLQNWNPYHFIFESKSHAQMKKKMQLNNWSPRIARDFLKLN